MDGLKLIIAEQAESNGLNPAGDRHTPTFTPRTVMSKMLSLPAQIRLWESLQLRPSP